MRESLKPIEPGCLAMVIAKPSRRACRCLAAKRVIDDPVGMVLKVVGPSKFPCGCCWTVRPPEWSDLRLPACPGEVLLRIDPDDEIREDELQLEVADVLERTLRKAGVWEG